MVNTRGARMKKYYNPLTLCLLAILLTTIGGCITIGGFGPRAKYKKTIYLQTPLQTGSTLNVQSSYGSITVRGADVADCNAIASITVQAPTEEEAKEIAEQIKIYFVPEGNTLTIKADKPRIKNKRSIGISYKITTPVQTSIECKTSYGKVNLNNLVGNVNANTSYGKIYCTKVNGQIGLYTSYGDVICKEIISNQSKVKTSYGDISFAYSQNSPAQPQTELRTSYGDIDLTAPPKFAGQVELSTSYGSISTDLPITVKGKISKKRITGTIGEGTGNLNLKTSYGSIKIK